MAMNFMNQAMGFGPNAFETEEERRKRLEQEAAQAEPFVQTVKTNPVTGQSTFEVKGPVAPGNAIYDRMLQVESGNRDFDDQGRPITSPRGAMFASQVMPATAANPGFGIQPAQAQTPEEYNRVGREYFDAMQRRYPSQAEAAIAAYNMGPGAVDRNIAANQGQFNVAQAPRETQNYIERVMNAIIPSAQAATPPAQPPAQATRTQPGQFVNLGNSQGPTVAYQAPTTPVAPDMLNVASPTAQPGQPMEIRDEEGNIVSYTPGQQPRVVNAAGQDITRIGGFETAGAQAALPPDLGARFESAKTPQQLMDLARDTSLPEWAQRLANQKVYEQLDAENKLARARQDVERSIQSGDTTGLARMMQSRREEGSWIKAIMLGYMGAPQLAAAELGKMGYGTTFQRGSLDGQSVMLEMRFDGLPMQGYNIATGQRLTEQELARASGTGMTGKVTTSGTYFQDRDTGQIVVRQSDEKGNVRVVDVASQQPYTGNSTRLIKLEEAGALRKIDAARVSDLAKKHGTNVLEAEAEYVKINGPFGTTGNPVTREQFREAYGFQLATPGAPAGAGTLKPTTGSAITTPAAGGAAATPTATGGAGRLNVPIAEQQITVETKKTGQKEIAKKAGETLGNRADLETQVKDVEKAIALLDSGKHNVGSVLSSFVGRGPLAQGIGRQFETTDARNTNTIMDTVQKLAADGLKTLGGNPSQADLEFWTRYKPSLSSDPEFVKQWIANAKQRIESRIGSAEQQIQSGGAPGSGSTQNKPGVSNW